MLKNLQRAQPEQQSDGKSKTIEPQPPHTFFDRPKHTQLLLYGRKGGTRNLHKAFCHTTFSQLLAEN